MPPSVYCRCHLRRSRRVECSNVYAAKAIYHRVSQTYNDAGDARGDARDYARDDARADARRRRGNAEHISISTFSVQIGRVAK